MIKEYETYEFGEVEENRKKWLAFLKKPGRKKAVGILDIGFGRRCCLGHGCFVLGIKKKKRITDVFGSHYYIYDGGKSCSPRTFVQLVGLRGQTGCFERAVKAGNIVVESLTELNDGTDLSPKQIAEFIEDNYDNVFLTREEYEEEGSEISQYLANLQGESVEGHN